MAKSGTKLGTVDLIPDVSPSRDIYWPRLVLYQVSLTFGEPVCNADLWSNDPTQ